MTSTARPVNAGVLAQRPPHVLLDLPGLDHTPGALPFSHGQGALGGSGHAVAEAFTEVGQVRLHLGVGEHAVVHGRAHHHRRTRRQERRADEVVGPALGGPGQEVGGGRRHADHVGFATEADVQRPPSGLNRSVSAGRP